MVIGLNIQILSNNEFNIIQSKNSFIRLKIIGSGTKNIFYSGFVSQYYPSEVYINGYKQNKITFNYNLNQTNNIIELRWNNNIISCEYMFYGCSDISDIDLSNFNSSFVTKMCYMFYGCSSLTSINLTNFDTSKVDHMHDLFHGCKSLTSLNLSSFDTSQVTWIDNIFYGCEKLEYINMKNFNEKLWSGYNNMFYGLPDNVIICIKENNIQEKIITQIKSKSLYSIDCTDNWHLHQKKFINITGLCIDINGRDIQYKYEFNVKYYENNINGNLVNNSTIKSCKCNLEKCLLCPNIALTKDFCAECNKNYYPIENDTSNFEGFFNCYKEPKGYYLDKNESIYKKCYYTCNTCEIEGNNITHNCKECNNNFPVTKNINNFINCYINCKYYYYFDKENNYHCTIDSSCPNEYPKLIKDKMECIKYNIKDIILKYENNETRGKEEDIKYYDNTLFNIESGFTSEYYDTSGIDNGLEEVIETGKIKITLTTTKNQINNTKDNMTLIDLGYCETLLREFYNISEDKLLYMKKIDVSQEGMKIPKVEFDIYCKLNGSNLIKLNISVCGNTKISLSVPVDFEEGVEKLNTSGDYYNDKCHKTTSKSGTDITLKDRQKEFVEGNKTVCQDNCNFFDYNENTQKVNCSCKIKESSSSVANMTIDSKKLYENFDEKNKKEISNLGLTSCNVFSSKENIVSNTGFFISLIILTIFIIIFILFCTRGYNSLERKINEVINKKFKKETTIKQTQKNNKIKSSTKKKI